MEDRFKTCLHCKHMSMSPSEPEDGIDMSISCAKRHWEFEALWITMEKYRAMMQKASSCPDFWEYSSTQVEISEAPDFNGKRRMTANLRKFLEHSCGLSRHDAAKAIVSITKGDPVVVTVQHDVPFHGGVIADQAKYYAGYIIEDVDFIPFG